MSAMSFETMEVWCGERTNALSHAEERELYLSRNDERLIRGVTACFIVANVVFPSFSQTPTAPTKHALQPDCSYV